MGPHEKRLGRRASVRALVVSHLKPDVSAHGDQQKITGDHPENGSGGPGDNHRDQKARKHLRRTRAARP